MALDGRDRARLERIELELASSDPALAARFRRWAPPRAPRALAPGWSVVPGWALVVFLIGFTTWVGAPVLGVFVAVGAVFHLLLRRTRHLRVGRARR